MNSLPRRSTGRITPTRKLVKKGSSLRDLRPLTERVVLEKVLGVTVNGNSGLACNLITGTVAYAAGCVIVIIGSPAQSQGHIVNSSRKTVSSLAFSPDGKFLVSGESGHQPSVRVWDAEDSVHLQVSEMVKGHKHGIQCVAFSPNMKYVVSVGFQHDMLVNIWNWREGTTIACNKVSSKVSAISFSENGDYFVTVGVRIVKFWYIDSDSATKAKKKVPLSGRPAILGEKRNNQFIDVACGVGTNSTMTYSVTKSGLLCSFNEKRLLDKWVEMRVNGAYSLTVNEQLIFCGCSDGIIRVFSSSSLQFIGSLPKPHCLGVDVAAGMDPSHLLTKVENAVYPDTIAITLDHQNTKLTCIYNDHSIYIWDIKDIKKIGKVSSFLYHNSCVWGVEVYPEVNGNYQELLPFGSFLTCSSDGTVRVWNIETGANIVTLKNIYSKELIRVLYTEKDLTCLKDTKSHSETSRKESDVKPGVRCLKVCHEGQQLATGDRMGNIRVFDLSFMDEIIKIEAHESEVLCIEYSTSETGNKLLASAGRDRLIHVFDCENNYNLVQTLDDHSASITSIKFNVSESQDFQLISCSADKSVIFRSANKDPDLQFTRYTNVASKTTFYDMDIHPSRNYAVTAGQDRNLRVYDISSGKQLRSFKGSMGDDGLILKVLLERSGFYAATSCSDKSLCLYDFDTGECVAGMVGHSEVVTGLQFTVDCKRLITVSGDGCIFVWRLPSAFTQNMSEKLNDHDTSKDDVSLDTTLRRETFTLKSLSQVDGISDGQEFRPATNACFENGDSSPQDDDYRFSMSKFPSWARKQIADDDDAAATSNKILQTSTTISYLQQPAGKWGQRFNQVNLKIQADSANSSVDDSSDWRRFSNEPNSIHENIRALARTPLEKRCSNGSYDEEDFFFQDAGAVLRSLEKEHGLRDSVEDLTSYVTTSRGSDVSCASVETRTYIETSVGRDTAEQAADTDIRSKEEQDIIYYPTEEDLDSEVARPYDVKVHEGSDEEKDSESPNTESPSREDAEDKTGDSLSDDEEEEEEDLLTKEIIPKWDELPEDPAPSFDKADAENGKEFLLENFECLGKTPTEEKDEPVFLSGPEAAPTKPLPLERNSFHRTSISARFILRSKQSSMRSSANAETSRVSEDRKTEDNDGELEKRKEEVTSTRKRLEAMGFKAMDNWGKSDKSKTDSKEETSGRTETDTANEERKQAVSVPDITLPGSRDAVVQVKETGQEFSISSTTVPSLSSSSDAHSDLSRDVAHLSSVKPASYPTSITLQSVQSPYQATTVPPNTLPDVSLANTTSSAADTADVITYKASSPLGSPTQTSFKVVRSPKGTIISSLELTNLPLNEDAPKFAQGDERAEDQKPNQVSHLSAKTSPKTSVADGELSPAKRASELIAFFDPGPKNKPAKQDKKTTTDLTQRSSSEARTKGETEKNKKSSKGDGTKSSRSGRLPFASKSNDKNTSQNRRSFPFNITKITKSKASERRSLAASKGDLSKAKSCGDLLHEQAKEEGSTGKSRRKSESQELTKNAPVWLQKETSKTKGLPCEPVKEDKFVGKSRKKVGSQENKKTAEVSSQKEPIKPAEDSPCVERKISDSNSKLSELSAELSAALATPAPQPIQINLSRNYLLDTDNLTSLHRNTATELEKGFSEQITKTECREVVVDLVRAFERALECHSKILQEDDNDDQQQALSMLSATFSTIQESIGDCKRDREQTSRSLRARLPEQKPAIETQQYKQTKEASQQTEHGFSQSDHEKIVPLLEKYSELLLEKLDHKISKS